MHQKREMILNCRDDVINGKKIIEPIISELFNISNEFLLDLSDAANRITRHFHGSKVDIEELANIKKNFCSEDCTFCSQSAFFNTKITGYELPPPEEIVKQALNAKNDGAGSFCLVAAWREPNTLDFEKVCTIIEEVNKKVGISVECSLGFLTDRQAKTLKKLQVKRYNHNLETSRSKFPEICTTHTYDDRVKTLKIARNAGLELCTGGIIGLGETRKQREELILEISELEPEEVTVNMLVPMPGTPLELQTQLDITEIEVNLKDDGQKLLLSGANGIISAGYLTMGGNAIKKDTEMINEINLEA